jgi:hypothetical protein
LGVFGIFSSYQLVIITMVCLTVVSLTVTVFIRAGLESARRVHAVLLARMLAAPGECQD